MIRTALCGIGALALLCPALAAAQTQAGFRIHVTDADGRPIEAAEVQVTDPADGTDAPDALLSNTDGDVLLDAPMIDPDRGAAVTVSAMGYRDARVHVAPGMEHDLAVRLEAADGDNSIVIVAKRMSRPFSPSTLGLLDIVTDARANADPVLAANDLPSSTNVAGNATLSLRATRPTISRLYLDDVPVFEFGRGGSLDNATQAGSILNLGNTKDVEAYPSNPPLYLAGSSGGALRALPPTTANPGGNLALNTAAIGLAGTVAPGDGGSFATLTGLYSDLQPQLALNDRLTELISRLRLRSVGLIGRAALDRQSALSVFAQAETEAGRYPVEILGARGEFRQDTDRERLLSSYATTLGAMALTANGSYTHAHSNQAYAGWSSASDNRYLFWSIDLGGDALESRLTYRLGIDSDAVSQSSRQAFDASLAPIGATAPTRVANRNDDMAAYGFASYRVGANTLISVGGRRTVASSLGADYGLQMSATASSADKKHKLIVSLGRYFGVELPQYAYDGGLARSVSRQIEADYSFTAPRLRLGLSVYHSEETADRTRSALAEGRFYVFDDTLTGVGRRTVTTGVELYADVSPVSGMEAKLSLSRIGQHTAIGGQTFDGSNDFAYIARGAVRYQIAGWGLNLAATARDGAAFTRVTSIADDPRDGPVPVTGPINGERLPPYFSVDTSIARPLALSASVRPLAFLSINNLLDRRNASSQILSTDPSSLRLRSYPGRVLTAGISLNF
ncbi:TonB-dependent receptor [Sphingomonas oligophenolica]|uniref:TonB-dependent receptor n=1 Tax=Sphingomonas oligophenolica TaxID=301154 RepID=A0A502CCU2_9SPHN|nr:TonB-dependent receptor [Sphingomonas oligophenolica]TPG10788.1 hypothetical protein EAH84_11915 [Sphingomonas oligophenolica]